MTEVEGWSNGDEAVAKENEILRILVGSTMYGTSVGSSDTDLMAVYVNTPQQLLGLAENNEHWTYRTQPEGVRSGASDIDMTSYSLRKAVRLATAGNPSIIAPLMAPEEFVASTSWAGEQLREMASEFVCRDHVRNFKGYFFNQVERMRGSGHVARMPNRVELVEKYGYDVKYAATAIRMALSGIELATTGRISLPMRQEDRELCISVRLGENSIEEVNRLFDLLAIELTDLETSSRNILRKEPDYAMINDWLASVTANYWFTKGLIF